ncbi:MAG: 16S rRNA (cytidine(1402)-2'-O)-methyltransferase [Acetobacteraceae bacterium]|nr:16S rRNA (cytidine(1402)-2'-O)-methyltransferase [Acetobacteraceae bacterium]
MRIDDEAQAETPPSAADDAAGPPGTLTLVATPIGNLGDLPPRAAAVLAAADAVLAEDTRVTQKLAQRCGLATRLVSLHDHNEETMTARVLARLAAGERIALVSDAGMPLIADPGYRLVRAAIAAGHRVTCVPGPSAATTALVLSGLPPVPFLFLGFPPPKAGPRRARFAELAALERAGLSATLVLFEAPHRVVETLRDLAQAFGTDRPAAVARELTKRFEEVVRGPLGELAARFAGAEVLGEIVVVVGPGEGRAEPAEEEIDAALRAALAEGLSVRDAAERVAAETRVPRRDAYARALRLKASAPE